MPNEIGWDRCMQCTTSVISIIPQVRGTNPRCFSMGITGRTCRYANIYLKRRDYQLRINLDSEQIIDFVMHLPQHTISFVKGRKDYVSEYNLMPNSKVIVETKPKEYTIFFSDKENSVQIIRIPNTLYDRLVDLKKAKDEELISENQFLESRQKLIDNFSEYFKEYLQPTTNQFIIPPEKNEHHVQLDKNLLRFESENMIPGRQYPITWDGEEMMLIKPQSDSKNVELYKLKEENQDD